MRKVNTPTRKMYIITFPKKSCWITFIVKILWVNIYINKNMSHPYDLYRLIENSKSCLLTKAIFKLINNFLDNNS